ncbi:MAG TPA: helicase-associated domain-containing protein [Desulfosporosinus sp.]|nr:helicase-associated domain-containing protein [Desulfosporosinus sp.]
MKKPAPKLRLVFGQKPPQRATHEVNKPLGNKSAAKSNSSKTSDRSVKQNPKPETWPAYFAKMDSTERILFAFTVYRQPKDASIEQLYSYNYDSFRYLDKDLPGPDYKDVARILSKWTKVGLLVVGRFSNLFSLETGAAEAFWQFNDKKVDPELFDVVPDKAYTSDLSGTLDNMFNFLVMIEQGDVLITRTHEINKHSLKRILAALKEPIQPDRFFTAESYFFWLLGVARFFQWFWTKGDRLELTSEGRELPGTIKVEDLLCQICPTHFRSIPNKGFFLVLPLLVHCTGWTSWNQMVKQLIPADNSCNLFPQDRVIGLLDPMRFLGLLDWGEYQRDILVRATPLGQFLIPKMLQGEQLEDYAAEIKSLTDQIYPMNGPDTAYVQPNFEILLPRSVSWTKRWALSQFAVLEQQDQMLKYRLDKTYLMNALKRGLPADEVLFVLKNLSAYPLPENLVLTLQQWVESFGQVTFVKLSLLECATPEQAASIASARKYRDYVLGLYSPTAVIVREVEKLRKLLEKQGIYPSTRVLDGAGVAGRKR